MENLRYRATVIASLILSVASKVTIVKTISFPCVKSPSRCQVNTLNAAAHRADSSLFNVLLGRVTYFLNLRSPKEKKRQTESNLQIKTKTEGTSNKLRASGENDEIQCFWYQLSSPCSFPQEQRGESWPSAAACQQAVMEAERESVPHCPHFKITPLLLSISASSSFRSTSPNVWQFPGLMCPLLYRHRTKTQTPLWDVSKDTDLSQADKGVQVIYKKRYCYSVSCRHSLWDIDRFPRPVFMFSSRVDGSPERRLKHLSSCLKWIY